MNSQLVRAREGGAAADEGRAVGRGDDRWYPRHRHRPRRCCRSRLTTRSRRARRAGNKRHRVICTLWCGHSHEAGDMRQPSVACNQSTVPDIEHVIRASRVKIQGKHAGCIAVAQAARAAADGPSSRPSPDAFAALMAARKAQQAADRAEAPIKAATALRDCVRVQLEAAERELAALTAAAVEADSQLPEAKRQRKQGVGRCCRGRKRPSAGRPRGGSIGRRVTMGRRQALSLLHPQPHTHHHPHASPCTLTPTLRE
jgi:hypothetical protein